MNLDVGTRALHELAYFTLRFSSPLTAARIVRKAARWVTPYKGADEAREAAARLEGRGTCLTRALAVAARLRGAHVVIGIDPSTEATLGHAWVELDAHPLREGDPRGATIAVL